MRVNLAAFGRSTGPLQRARDPPKAVRGTLFYRPLFYAVVDAVLDAAVRKAGAP